MLLILLKVIVIIIKNIAGLRGSGQHTLVRGIVAAVTDVAVATLPLVFYQIDTVDLLRPVHQNVQS